MSNEQQAGNERHDRRGEGREHAARLVLAQRCAPFGRGTLSHVVCREVAPILNAGRHTIPALAPVGFWLPAVPPSQAARPSRRSCRAAIRPRSATMNHPTPVSPGTSRRGRRILHSTASGRCDSWYDRERLRVYAWKHVH